MRAVQTFGHLLTVTPHPVPSGEVWQSVKIVTRKLENFFSFWVYRFKILIIKYLYKRMLLHFCNILPKVHI
jgi:hypothetical protein